MNAPASGNSGTAAIGGTQTPVPGRAPIAAVAIGEKQEQNTSQAAKNRLGCRDHEIRNKPMRMDAFFCIAAFCLAVAGLVPGPAVAAGLVLSGNRYYIAMASRKTLDEAIGFARSYDKNLPVVMLDKDGLYTAIRGPVTVKHAKPPAWIRRLVASGDVPAGAKLVRGNEYKSIAWRMPKSPVLAEGFYDDEQPFILHGGGVTIHMYYTREGDKNIQHRDISVPSRHLVDKFEYEEPKEYLGQFVTEAKIVRLDKKSEFPQIAFETYADGDRYSKYNWIETLNKNGKWTSPPGLPEDENYLYNFEQIPKNRLAYIIETDDNFYIRPHFDFSRVLGRLPKFTNLTGVKLSMLRSNRN